MCEVSNRVRLMSQGALTPKCPWSVREVYHPAVQDFSRQAARMRIGYHEESMRHAKYSTENDSYKLYTQHHLQNQLNAEEIKKFSPTAQLYFKQYRDDSREDLFSQRVLVSAYQRYRIKHQVRRAKSTPPCSNDVRKEHRNSVTPSEESEKVNLLITNGIKCEETEFKKIPYRLASRTKPKSNPDCPMSNGVPLPIINGYMQTLIQSYPKYTPTFCGWLTNGLKVKSLRGNNDVSDDIHTRVTRPSRPLHHFIHRPKTMNRGLVSECSKRSVDFNFVGVQKEVIVSNQNPTNPTEQSDNSLKNDDNLDNTLADVSYRKRDIV